jgi:V8-like Glu-specific endopeptidase
MITSKKNRHQSTLVIFTLLTTLLISCGKQDQTSGNGVEVFDSQIIIGDVDWREISSLSSTTKIRKASSPVADVKLPVMGSRCTGFLISEDVLMTNEHCIPTEDHAAGVTASFRHLKGVSEENWETYNCSTFIMNNAQYDFALLKCSGAPGRKFGFVKLDASAKRVGTPIYVVQQNCDYYSDRGCDWTKKYSKGKIVKVEDEYVHNADTLGGSSGSPMFDYQTHKVVGLHHAGYGNNGMGRGYENYSVPMKNIVPIINSRFPGLIGGSSSSNPGNSTPSDKTEPNNSVSKAYKLSGKTQTLSNVAITDSKDLDFYSVKAKSGAKVKIKTEFKHSSGDLDVYRVDSKGAVLQKVESSNDNEELTFTSNGSTAYFVVFGYKGAKNAYKLKVTVTGGSSTPQSNNTMATATVLSSDSSFADALEYKNDVDYYKFSLRSSKTVKASIEFTHSRGDLDFKLYDTNGKLVKSSAGTKNIESISMYLKKGTYYLKVYGYKGAKNSYDFKLDI